MGSTRIILVAAIAAGALYWYLKRQKSVSSDPYEHSGVQPHLEDRDAADIDDLGHSAWDSQFDRSNRVTAKRADAIEHFEAGAQGAEEEDSWGLYNSEDYMPQEKHDDWFQTVQVPQTIKNQHLLMHPIGQGISTVGNSQRIKNHDLRPVPFCPKFAVSPWGNSSYEPSTSRSRALC
jgi:hypothetical protein